MNDEEVRQLASLCELSNLPAADVIRSCVFKNKIPKAKVPRLDLQTYVELKRIGNNINQIAKQYNSKLEVPLERLKALASLSDKLDYIIKHLINDR
ncbi:MobC family plasmid mobilization relaxosome protein [Belliella sp. R4-6]|uniref:MobC family plasmid mobilization relaxosome protein n=2 Tax=Belliella alkalica TaxID=1730871 RepID=A0ABS9V631_9BACT|nr:MobC family plasmid mobilization relaxosome protein [Belliella alkalica]